MAVCALDGRTVVVASPGQTVFTFEWDADLIDDADVVLWFKDVSAGTPASELDQGAGAGKFVVDRIAKTCTLGTAAEVDDEITMERHQSSPTRLTTFTNPGDLIPQSINNEFDHFLQGLEDLGRDRCRSVRMSRGVDLTSLNLELPDPSLNRALGWISSTALGNLTTIVVTEIQADKFVAKADGSASAPAFTWNTGTDSGEDNGHYLSASNQFSAAVNGVNIVDYKATEVHFKNNVKASGRFIAGSGSVTITNAAGKLLLAAIEQGGANTGDQLVWDGSVWAPELGAVGGLGTLNTIPLWTPDGFTLGDSVITQSGSAISISGTLASGALTVTGNIIASGYIRSSDGTEAAPGLRLATDASGFYHAASGIMGWSIQGVERARLVSSGQFIAGLFLATGEIKALISTAGTTIPIITIHADNTNASSHAIMLMQTGGASGGDPYTEWNVSGVQQYTMGIRNSDSDKFVGSVGSVLGTANWLEVTTAGAVTLANALASGALTVTGTIVASGNLQVNGGGITSSTGAISFGNENLSTTGTLACGVLTVTGDFNLTSGDLSIVNGNLEVFAGNIAAGSLEIVLTTSTGLLRHQAIDPAIAGSGLSVTAGVLSVAGDITLATGNITLTLGNLIVGGTAKIGGGSTSSTKTIVSARTGTRAELYLRDLSSGFTTGDNRKDGTYVTSEAGVFKLSGQSDSGSGTGAYFQVDHSTAAGLVSVFSDLFIEDDLQVGGDAVVSGQLGINTTAAANVQLDVLLVTPASTVIFRKNSAIPSAPILQVIQDNASGDIEAMSIQQDRPARGFINFKGSDRGVISSGTSSLKSIRVEVDGVIGRLAFYADA